VKPGIKREKKFLPPNPKERIINKFHPELTKMEPLIGRKNLA